MNVKAHTILSACAITWFENTGSKIAYMYFESPTPLRLLIIQLLYMQLLFAVHQQQQNIWKIKRQKRISKTKIS